MAALTAKNALASNYFGRHAVRVGVIRRAAARINELCANLQVLQVIRFRLHVLFQVGQKLGQRSIRQALDDVFLLVEV